MFAVNLPLAHVSAQPQSPARIEAPLLGRLIILVDDELSILQAAAFILEKAGCEVMTARSAKEALDAATKCSRTPDAIICDYELHDDLKGPEVIKALREEFAHDIPAMLVTGDTGAGPVERIAQEMGVSLLYKPLESAELRSSLGALLGSEEHSHGSEDSHR
jgi:CheY-like chemotaxis protein